MIKTILTLSILLVLSIGFSQGLVNNGARIVLSNSVNIVVNGATGNYTNQNSGLLSVGTGNGTVKLQGNWVNNATNVVFSNDGITTELYGANQSIGGTNSTTFYNLTLSGSGTKTLNIDAKAGGISTTTGVVALNDRALDLNQHILEITNPAPTAFTRTSGFVVSETNMATNPSIIRWNTGNAGNYVFPFGASGDYIPIGLDKTSAGASTVSASTRATTNVNTPWATGVTNMNSAVLSLPDASVETTIDRWYSITTSNPVVANLTLSYRGAENTTTLSPNGTFSMQRWNGLWEDQQGSGTGLTTGVGSVTANSVSAFSNFVLTTATSFGPLPITLKAFAGTCNNNGIQLTWTTASESNVNHFEIYRTRDGQAWEKVADVNAVGNSSTANTYHTTDAKGIETMYYKLRSVDNDGTYEDFNPISVKCNINGQTWNLHPVPAETQVTIAIETDKAISDNIVIMDMNGKIVHIQAVNLEIGVNYIILDVQQFAKGTYVVKMNNETEYKPLKLMKID